jgi:hypothetical protein
VAERRRLTAAGALTLVERVLRGGHNVFFELLDQAADNVVSAAELLHGLLAGGAGAAKRLSAVRWGVAREIVIAWILTLPSAALVGAAVYVIANLFGHGDAGPIVLSVALAIGVLAVFLRARGGPGQLSARSGATPLEATQP